MSEMGSNVVVCAYVLKCTFPGNIIRVKQSALTYFVYVVYRHGQKKGLAQAVIQIFCSQSSLKYEQCGAMIPQSNETKQYIEWKKKSSFELKSSSFELKTSSFELKSSS